MQVSGSAVLHKCTGNSPQIVDGKIGKIFFRGNSVEIKFGGPVFMKRKTGTKIPFARTKTEIALPYRFFYCMENFKFFFMNF